MFAISEAASLALHAVTLLPARSGSARSTTDLSGELGVSRDHLAKVLQRLAKEGLVESVRGPRGGYRLAEGAEATSLRNLYEAVEGPLETGGCLLGRPVCAGDPCALAGLVHDLPRRAARYLDATTLADLRGSTGAGTFAPVGPGVTRAQEPEGP